MEIKLTNKSVTVVLSADLQSQINFLHSQCEKNTEWSGLLIYNIEEGVLEDFLNLENPKSYLELRALGLFPMDYGDSTYTSFEAGDKWIRAFEQYPEIDPMSPKPGYYIGKLHTHHSMAKQLGNIK